MLTMRVRRALLAILAFIFVISAAITILYIQGWRFDVQKFSVEKVGAIYIRSFPQDAAITINGKSAQNGSWFLSRGTFISDLFPKNYHIALSEPNYLPWQETVTVSPSLVTEINHAVLVPRDALPMVPATPSSSIASFWLSGNDTPLNLTSDSHLTWNAQKISGSVPLGMGESDIYLLTEDAIHETFYIHNFTSGTNSNLNTLLKEFGINLSGAQVVQYREKIAIATATRISLWDISKLTLGNADAEDISIPAATLAETMGAAFDPATAHIAVSQFFIAWNMHTPTSSIIAVYDPFLEKIVSTSPTLSGESKELSWNARGLLSILQTNGDFFTFDPTTGTLAQVASDVASFSWDQSGLNVAALEHAALEIFLAGNDNNYYRFRLPDMSAFEDAIWYKDNAHLFLAGTGRVTFLDLKDGGLENLVTTQNAQNAAYDQVTNTLYFLRDGHIMALAFPSN